MKCWGLVRKGVGSMGRGGATLVLGNPVLQCRKEIGMGKLRPTKIKSSDPSYPKLLSS